MLVRTTIGSLTSWWGMAEDASDRRFAKVLTFHATPARHAASVELQLRFLKHNFDVVPLAEIVGRVEQNEPPRSNCVALTFDDGLRNNVEVLYPILKRLRLPATFFVCPGLIERGETVWTLEARRRARYLQWRLKNGEPVPAGLPAVALDGLVEWMKTRANDERVQVMQVLREASGGFIPSQQEKHDMALAGWDELRSLDESLITIGSHTMTHPILSRCAAQDVVAELADSREMIENRLQRSADFFCYPDGDHNEIVRQVAGRHYRAAVTTEETWVPRPCELTAIPRVPAPLSTLRLCWNMYRPAYDPTQAPPAISLPPTATA
jgi:peptidoglycan/xylan/chitin deacetylase (PgdA/CDA1 family)